MKFEKTIEIKNVTKIINNNIIIDQFNLTINKGEVFGLIGPNGAGKTTLLKMITGLMSVSSGEIIICGRKNKNANFPRIGAIIEYPNFYNYLSGRRNLELASNKYHNNKHIDKVIKEVRLEKRINDKVSDYSLGMKQRLGIAQALLHDPEILILDEPTNGLDPIGIIEMRNFIKTLADVKGISVIISSHMLNEIEKTCDRIGVMKEGKLLYIENLKSSLSSQGKYSYLIDTNDNKTIKNILISKEVPVEEVEEGIKIKIKKEEVTKVINYILQSKKNIYNFSQLHSTLEEKYLQLNVGRDINDDAN